MMTDSLIDDLVRGIVPVGRPFIALRLFAGLAAGALISGSIMLGAMGLRPDLATALFSSSFWMKLAYTSSFATLGLVMSASLARPDGEGRGAARLLLLPVIVLALLSATQLSHSDKGQWPAMWLGGSWKSCSSLIFLLSIPLFAGTLWSFGRFAPTRLSAAGAAAGLAAGASAATIYSFHCPEVSAAFVLGWYSLGIGLAAMLGALAGPRLLRW